MTDSSEKWVHVGRVGRAKGLTGQVRVEMFNPSSKLLYQVDRVALGEDQEQTVFFSIEEVSSGSRHHVVQFKNIRTRSDAEGLVGKQVYVNRSQLPELPEGQYYHFDLLGSLVETEAGKRLGVLREIMSTGANDVYVIDGPNGEFLLPATKDVILRIDPLAQKVTVRLVGVADAL